MKKTFALIALITFSLALLSSCRAQRTCPAYSDAPTELVDDKA